MVEADRSPVARDAAHACRDLVPKLLGCHLEVMRLAQIAGVAVLVAATVIERLDVINAGRLGDAPEPQTHLAEAIGALEAAQALCLPCPAA
nr:hypothetical protein [Sphingomonas echinoides]